MKFEFTNLNSLVTCSLMGCWEAPVKRLLCWRRRSCIFGLTGVNAAGVEGRGVVIAFQSSPCLWKKRLHRWRRRNWRQKQRDEGNGDGMLVSLSVFSSVYIVSFCSSLSYSCVCSLWFFTFFSCVYIYIYTEIGRNPTFFLCSTDVVPPTPLPIFNEQMGLWSFPPPINSALCECLTGNFTHLSIEILEALR
jgi:hypothetical protein